MLNRDLAFCLLTAAISLLIADVGIAQVDAKSPRKVNQNKSLTIPHSENKAAIPPNEVTSSAEVNIILYFDGSDNATNHPGTGSGTTPNWFYYWLQTSASFGSPRYDPRPNRPLIVNPPPQVSIPPGNHGYTNYENNTWIAFLGPGDNDQDSPADGKYKNTLFNGIDLFAVVSRHEGRHVETSKVWYPNGYDPFTDLDSDGMPDSQEGILGAVPDSGGPFSPVFPDTDFDGLPDVEDFTHWTQTVWLKGSADKEDWSNPGHQ